MPATSPQHHVASSLFLRLSRSLHHSFRHICKRFPALVSPPFRDSNHIQNAIYPNPLKAKEIPFFFFTGAAQPSPRQLVLLLALFTWLGPPSGASGGVADSWPMVNLDPGATRYSPLSQ